jgi:hypothetical protein
MIGEALTTEGGGYLDLGGLGVAELQAFVAATHDALHAIEASGLMEFHDPTF